MKKILFSFVWLMLNIGSIAQSQVCQTLPEGDCNASCGNSCNYREPVIQDYQFDLPEHLPSTESPQRLGAINQRGSNISGQLSPYSLPFFINIPTDYYDLSKAGLPIKIDTIPYDSSKLNLGIQFQVTSSTRLSTTGRSIASNEFTGTYVRCVSRTKNAGPCATPTPAPTPPPSCSPTWSDTGCVGANSMGTYDSCNNVTSTRPEGSCSGPVAVDCVGSWGACTGSCGTGTKTFSISVPASVSPPGAACSEVHGATQACPLAVACPPTGMPPGYSTSTPQGWLGCDSGTERYFNPNTGVGTTHHRHATGVAPCYDNYIYQHYNWDGSAWVPSGPSTQNTVTLVCLNAC